MTTTSTTSSTRVTVTSTSRSTSTTLVATVLDPNLFPVFESTVLTAGFTPDPFLAAAAGR